MYITNMVYARKKSGVYKKTKRGNMLSPMQNKSIVSLIKKVSKGQAETGSSYWNTGDISLIKQQLYSQNLMQVLGLSNITGSADSGLIKGDQIQPIGLSIKGIVYSTSNSPCITNITVLKTDKYTTLSGGLGSNDVMKFGDGLNHLPRWNSEEVKVLFSKNYKSIPQIGSIDNPIIVDEYVKFNDKNLQFLDFSTDYSLKHGNYYVVYHSSNIPGTLGTTVVSKINLNCRFFYKDY